MQSIVIVIISTLAVANAGLLATPVVHATQIHAAPVVHTVHPVVQTVHAVHTPTLYKTAVIPTAYATSYKYRAAPAKIAIAHPVVVAAPKPLYQAIVPTAYASSYSYRAPPAKLVVPVVQKVVAAPTVIATPVVHKTVVHAAPVVATPLVHKTVIASPVAVHHPIVHHAPTVLVH